MTARANATPKTPKTATSETRAKQAAIAEARSAAPDLAARIGSTPATTFRGNPDIFGRLVEDHDRHRALFAMVQDTDAKSPQREALFEELVKEIQSHAAAEEQALWSTVLRNPDTTEDANRLFQSKTPTYRWLVANADRFGFFPYVFEPWHWEYAGGP